MGLIQSCINGDSEDVLERLNDPDIESKFYNNMTEDTLKSVFMIACDNKMVEVALKLLDKVDLNYNHRDVDGNNALVYIYRNRMESVALKLMERDGLYIDDDHNCTTWLRELKEKEKCKNKKDEDNDIDICI
jgi:hypothetical protein